MVRWPVMTSSTPTIFFDHPLSNGNPPLWACAWGDDAFGPWALFRVGDARQKMRWILPGSFRMGSPETEAGRRDNEGPPHDVELSDGFWLFDTPCTQRLWQAVMGENPSRFQAPDRLVERVSWEDCQQFVRRIAELVPGLKLSLPTEAQWEYACRAGNDTATYADDLQILGVNNAPVLDEIAWYGGNCGVEFDLSEGESTTDRNGKQYEFAKGGTRSVAKKKPNGWGLYDMLGNVWEWCLDGKREYAAVTVRDPCGPQQASADRVIRGGSWYGPALHVRSAFRYWIDPSNRYDDLGFRCSSSGREQGAREGGAGAAPGEDSAATSDGNEVSSGGAK